MDINTIKLPIASSDVVEFTPIKTQGSSKNATYSLLVPTPLKHADYEATLVMHNAMPVAIEELLGELRRAVRGLYDPKQAKVLLQMIDRSELRKTELSELNNILADINTKITEIEAGKKTDSRKKKMVKLVGDKVKITKYITDLKDDNLQGDISELEDIIRENWPAYRNKLAQHTKFVNLAPVLTCQIYIAGVKNAGWEMAGDQLSDAELVNIPQSHQILIWSHVKKLLSPDQDLAKN